MNNSIKNFQLGKFFILSSVVIWLFVLIAYIFKWGNNPIPLIGFLVITAVIIIVLLLFYGMTTIIDDHTITILFGIGIIRFKIYLAEIESVEIVKTPWYYGLGIRFIPNGRLYNINWTDTIELKIKERKRIIRIGTDEAEKLKYEIEKRIKKN